MPAADQSANQSANRSAYATADQLPTVSGWLQAGFHRYLPGYLRRHFSLVALDRDGYQPAAVAGRATLVYANHPGWFDPLIAHYLTRRLFVGGQFYAPIDAQALQQYQVFAKLGFYGIDLQSAAGAAGFLKTSKRILAQPRAVLWLTPEGRFCDVRDHQQPLQPGLAHLCWRAAQQAIAAPTSAASNPASMTSTAVLPLQILPLAIEYAFWDQRLPVCLLRFGRPLLPSDLAKNAGHAASDRSGADRAADMATRWDKATWARQLAERLRSEQRQLAQAVIARQQSAWLPLLSSRAGAGGGYDLARRLKCWLTGRRYQPQHGNTSHGSTADQPSPRS